ncbi:MAG: glycosyltransferase family 2 protein [Chitinophagaceae bacterium]
MQISGFTFVRNAVKFDYPVVESITSILPIVDEFIVSVGNSEDQTPALIRSINSPKIKIIDSVWDDSLKTGGKVLAAETDKAFARLSANSDWAFYLQADEILHERYLETIQRATRKYLNDSSVEGLLFNYLHFYGTYDYTGDSRRWYNREIRIIRNNKAIRSYLDAQGFRISGRKLRVKPVDACIYHYGWVKPPEVQMQKIYNTFNFWGGDDLSKPATREDTFNYLNDADSLVKFTDSHPEVMKERIRQKNWEVDFDLTRKKLSLKNNLLYRIEKITGVRLFDYKNYRII